MRLCDMPSEMGLKLMLDILPPMQEILTDPDFPAPLTEGPALGLTRAVLPLMVEKHLPAVMAIAGAVTGCSEPESLPLGEVLEAFSSAFDGAVLRFFSFCAALGAMK